MKIAYILSDFPVFSETFVGDEMRAMQALGHTIVPIAIKAQREPGQEADRELAALACRVPEIPARYAAAALGQVGRDSIRAIDFMYKQKLIPKKSLLWNALKIAGAARRHDCTHLHAHFAGGATAHAIVAARMIGATVSFICHGHDVYSEPEDLPAKLNAADFAIATCADMGADLRAMAPAATIELYHCGIDAGTVMKQNAAEPNRKLLFIGRLVEQKGVDDVLHALAGMKPEMRLHLDIAGDGPQREALEALASEKGLSGSWVTFLGPKPREWFFDRGPAYTALVTPFKAGPNGERDSSPLIVKEAMAMGVPVISSRYMGVKEMVTPLTGLLIEPGDIDGLRSAIEIARSWTPEERAELIAKAHDRVMAAFTLQKQAATLSHLISEAQRRHRTAVTIPSPYSIRDLKGDLGGSKPSPRQHRASSQ